MTRKKVEPDEEIFGKALEDYYEGGKSREDILARVPEGKRDEVAADFDMIDFMQEMAKEEEEGL